MGITTQIAFAALYDGNEGYPDNSSIKLSGKRARVIDMKPRDVGVSRAMDNSRLRNVVVSNVYTHKYRVKCARWI